MKYKVGDKVRIVTLPNKIYTVADVYEAWEGYRLAEYPRLMISPRRFRRSLYGIETTKLI